MAKQSLKKRVAAELERRNIENVPVEDGIYLTARSAHGVQAQAVLFFKDRDAALIYPKLFEVRTERAARAALFANSRLVSRGRLGADPVSGDAHLEVVLRNPTPGDVIQALANAGRQVLILIDAMLRISHSDVSIKDAFESSIAGFDRDDALFAAERAAADAWNADTCNSAESP